MSSSNSYKWKKKDRRKSRKPYDRAYNEQPWYLKYKLESYLPNWVVNVKNYFLTNVADEADENNIEQRIRFDDVLCNTRPVQPLDEEGVGDENEEVEEVDNEEEEEEEDDEEEEDEEDAEDVEEEEEEEIEDIVDVPDTEEEEEVVSEEAPKLPVKETSKYDFKVKLANTNRSSAFVMSELPGSSKISTATAQRFSGKRKLGLGPISTPTPSTSRGVTNEVRDEEGSSSSENTASSTSGCSSLAPSNTYLQKLSLPADKDKTGRLRKELLSNTRDVAVETDNNKQSVDSREANRRSLLWSSVSNPRFNVSKFTSPTSIIPRGINSPYYEGKTTYGGASAKRARLAAPFNKLISPTSPSNNLKIQIHNRNSDNGKKLKSEDLLSDAAKRILANIEKISSPLEDAKKIPVYGSIDTSKYLSEPKRSTIRTPYSRPVKSTIPFSSLKSTPLTPIDKPQLKWSLTQSETGPADKAESSSLPFRDLESAPYGGFAGDRNSGPGSGGGKIRSRKRKNSGDTHKLFDTIDPPELPNVPLNITTLPSFSFAKSPAEATSLPSTSMISLQKPNNCSTPHKDSVKEASESGEARIKPTTTIEAVENESEKENKVRKSETSVSTSLKHQPVPVETSAVSVSDSSKVVTSSSNKVIGDVVDGSKHEPKQGGKVYSPIFNSKSKISADAALAALEGKSDDESEPRATDSPKIDLFKSSESSVKSLEAPSTKTPGDKPVDKFNSTKLPTFSFGKPSVESTPLVSFNPTAPPKSNTSPSIQRDIFKESTGVSEQRVKPTTTIEAVDIESVTESKVLKDDVSTPVPLKDQPAFNNSSIKLATSSIKSVASESSKNVIRNETVVPKSNFTKDSINAYHLNDSKISADPVSMATASKKSDDNQETRIKDPKTDFFKSSEQSENSRMTEVKAVDKSNVSNNSDSFFDKFKPAPGDWTCDTCCLRNKPDALRCVSCEEPKKGAEDSKEPSTSAITNTGFTFNSPSSGPSGSSSFGFNAFAMTTSPSTNQPAIAEPTKTTSTFNFGNDANKASGAFSFGSGPTISKPTSSFEFGKTTAPSTPSTSAATPATISEPAKTTSSSGFRFGLDPSKPGSNAFPFGSNSDNITPATSSSGFAFAKTTSGTSTTTATSAPSSFMFGNPSSEASNSFKTTTADTNTTPSGPVFSRSSTTSSATVQPSSNAFAFNKTSNTTPSQPFSFGTINAMGETSSTTEQPKPASLFAFGSSGSAFPSSTTTQPPSSTSNTLTTSKPFSFGSPSTLSTPSSFNFTPNVTTTTPQTSQFTFGLPKPSTSTAPSVPAVSTSSTASAFAFGSSTAGTSGGFSFGQPTSSTGPSSSNPSGYVFGSSTNNNASSSLVTPGIQSNAFGSTSTFNFNPPPSTPQSQAPTAAASNAVFNFGAGGASSNFTQPNLGASSPINFETPSNFNFLNSAPSQQGGLFRFDADNSSTTSNPSSVAQRNIKKAKRRLHK